MLMLIFIVMWVNFSMHKGPPFVPKRMLWKFCRQLSRLIWTMPSCTGKERKSRERGEREDQEFVVSWASLCRIVGYKLEQFGLFELAAQCFENSLKIRGEEPQSLRDLALSLIRLDTDDAYKRFVQSFHCRKKKFFLFSVSPLTFFFG